MMFIYKNVHFWLACSSSSKYIQEHDKRTHLMVPQSSLRHINLDKIFHQVPQIGSALRLWCWATTMQRLLKQENLNVVMVEGSSAFYAPGLIQDPYWAPKGWQWGTLLLPQVHQARWGTHICYHNREEPHLSFNIQHLLRYHIRVHHSTWYGITWHY